mmetsp:Transcript_7952/g.20263  ORF Transcript_7952/g.20263 Transcript_7952/m.20263 type:complete len:280 (+) Transcript_7952:616-1455(+)
MARDLLRLHIHHILLIDEKPGPHRETRKVFRIVGLLLGNVKSQRPLLDGLRCTGLAEFERLQDLWIRQEDEIFRLGPQPQRPQRAIRGLASAHDASLCREAHDPVLRVLDGRHQRLHAQRDHIWARAARRLLEKTLLGVLDDRLHALLRRYAADQLRHDKVHLLGEVDLHGVARDDLNDLVELLLLHRLACILRRLGVDLDGVDLRRPGLRRHDRQQRQGARADVHDRRTALHALEALADRRLVGLSPRLVVAHGLVLRIAPVLESALSDDPLDVEGAA